MHDKKVCSKMGQQRHEWAGMGEMGNVKNATTKQSHRKVM